jgi:hypothetical protein
MSQPTRYRSQYPDRAVRAKTREVADYHHDESKPGKPLHLMVPGGLVALASLALIVWTIWAAYLDETLNPDSATQFLCLLVPVYIGGVFLFSYGYELYDVPQAIRLTAIIVFLTVAAVLIVAVLLALLGGSKEKGGGSIFKGATGGGSKGGGMSVPIRSGSSSSSSSVGSGVGDVVGGVIGGMADSAAYGAGRVAGSMPPIVLNVSPTQEVIREVPVEAPAPQPIACPFCGRSYIPAETKFQCPNCGAATPPEFLAPGEGPQPVQPSA